MREATLLVIVLFPWDIGRLLIAFFKLLMSLVKPQTFFNSKLTSRPSPQTLVCGKTGKEHNSLSRAMSPLLRIWSLELLYFDFPTYKMKRLLVGLKKMGILYPTGLWDRKKLRTKRKITGQQPDIRRSAFTSRFLSKQEGGCHAPSGKRFKVYFIGRLWEISPEGF